MRNIKIKVYNPNYTKVIPNDIISNADAIDFTEDINSGQFGISVELLLDYNNTDYTVGDFVEYSIYDDENKNGLLKFSGIIKKIGRSYSDVTQRINLECESIKDLLVQKKVNKTYSGTYKSIVDDIITDMGVNTCDMEFLGNKYIKNLVQDTNTASVTIDGTLLQALQKLFENKTFFINQFGEIKDTFVIKHIIVFGKDIISADMTEDNTGISEVELEARTKQDINAGDYIKIINTTDFLNLDNQQITKLDFSTKTKNIIIGKRNQLKTT